MSVATNQTCDRKTRWEMVGKVAFDVSSARFSSSVLVVLSGETLITVGDVGESGPSAKEQGAGRTTGLPGAPSSLPDSSHLPALHSLAGESGGHSGLGGMGYQSW